MIVSNAKVLYDDMALSWRAELAKKLPAAAWRSLLCSPMVNARMGGAIQRLTTGPNSVLTGSSGVRGSANSL